MNKTNKSYFAVCIQVLVAISAHLANAEAEEYRPVFKDYRNSDGQTLVNIDNPETRAQQYHTVDFDRSKFTENQHDNTIQTPGLTVNLSECVSFWYS